MSYHSINEAERDLAALIERAAAGEEIVIGREGGPFVALRPASEPPLRHPGLDWLASRRVGRRENSTDSATLVRQMRDEGY
jgi:hypothetical protein